MKKRSRECIVVFSAHSDDFVIGAGGTIAKYAKEGHKVISVIFSKGEKSHPWLKEDVVREFRTEETLEAAKVLGCEVKIFDLKEMKFSQDYKKKKYDKDLLKLLEKYKPTKLFTHSNEDPHPDHKAVNNITLELVKKLKDKPELYIYSIWNPVSFKTQFPMFYVDISKHFRSKLNSLNKFPSQKYNAIYPLIGFIWFRALRDGFRMRKKFGESFYRIQ
jgi:N-acetylglucosamine malate deacetylase 1